MLKLTDLEELKRRIGQQAADTIDELPDSKHYDRVAENLARRADEQCDDIDHVIAIARHFNMLEETKRTGQTSTETLMDATAVDDFARELYRGMGH